MSEFKLSQAKKITKNINIEYILNPITKRKIKIGSKQYKKLLKNGTIIEEQQDKPKDKPIDDKLKDKSIDDENMDTKQINKYVELVYNKYIDGYYDEYIADYNDNEIHEFLNNEVIKYIN